MALEIFRLIGSVFVDTDAANKSLRNTDENAGKLGQSLITGIQNVGKFVAGAAAAVTAAGAGIVALTETTRDYRTEQGKLQTAFETNNFSAEAARKTYEALNGILGDSGQAVEAANHLALLANNERELKTWTEICTGVYATFGDSLPIEGLTEAANETAKVGKVTGPLADALNWAGISEDKFNESLAECTTEQQRQALITVTLNELYSEAADHYRDTNAEVIAANEAQDKLNSTMANIGSVLEPIVTKGKEFLADVLEKATPYIQLIAEKVIPLLSQAIETLLDWIIQAIQWLTEAYVWITEHQTAVTLIAIAIGTLTVAIIAYNVAQNAASIATKAVTVATTAWGTAVGFLTSPVTLVVLAIGALIAIVYLLVENWDKVKAAGAAAWEWIKNAWNSAATWFDEKIIQPVAKFFSDLWSGIKKAASDAWDGVKKIWEKVSTWFDEKIVQPVKKFFSDLWSGITGAASDAWDGIKRIWNKVTTWFDEKIVKPIAKLFSGLWSGLVSGVKAPINAIIGAINKFIQGLNKLKIPDWVPGVGGKGINIPTIPKLEEGGVLRRGQVGLLEGNGAEAVVPLDKNKKWIQAVAQDMNSALGGGGGDQIVAVLMDILQTLEALTGMGLYIDKDKLIGYLAKGMDRKLGQLQLAKGRA